MPDRQFGSRTIRTSDHSLLLSLVVSGLLILGFAIGLKVYGTTSMADGAVELGVDVTVDKLYRDGEKLAVVLPDGDIDDLNYVTDPADYRAPLEVRLWDQPDKRAGVDDRVVFAAQDLEHLTGATHRRWITIGFVTLLVLFLASATYLNWPRQPRPE